MPLANSRNATTPKARIITNGPSDGARALQDRLDELGINTSRVRADRGPKTPRRFNVKWGCFPLTVTNYGGPMINGTSGEVSLNKLLCFQALAAAGIPVPQFTAEAEVARRWMAEGCRRIYERHSLRGSEGEGIRIVGEGGHPVISDAPLYTKGMFGRRREYRVHVFSVGDVRRIFVQQKRRRTTGINPADNAPASTIRNLANGWIFAHNDIVAPRQATIDAAVASINTLNLQFGAVDMIEMDRPQDGGSVVLEVNCAPGLMGGTLDFYAHAISDHLRDIVREVAPVATAEGTEAVEGPVGGFDDPEA
jgi:Glutathione synthase/Ribosomal protein S6 modification enzyme (glutaminyl transferase)